MKRTIRSRLRGMLRDRNWPMSSTPRSATDREALKQHRFIFRTIIDTCEIAGVPGLAGHVKWRFRKLPSIAQASGDLMITIDRDYWEDHPGDRKLILQHEVCHLAEMVLTDASDGHGEMWQQLMYKCGASDNEIVVYVD